jgi:hypothetical protein
MHRRKEQTQGVFMLKFWQLRKTIRDIKSFSTSIGTTLSVSRGNISRLGPHLALKKIGNGPIFKTAKLNC